MGIHCKHRGLYLMHGGVLNGREIRKAGDICKCMTDSFCYTVKANTTF